MSKILTLKDQNSHANSFQLKAKDKKKKYAELTLYGTIGESFWEEGITAKMVSDALKDFGEIETLDVRINSMGGDVFEGVTIYNRLKQLKANVTVYVDGLAASIATVIAMAGNEVVLSEGTLFMVHSPMTGVFGNQRDMEEKIQILDTIEEEMIGIYTKRTNLSRSEIRSLLHNETWMNSTEAIDNGFADLVAEDAQMVALSTDQVKNFSKMYRNIPTNKILTQDELVKNKLKSFQKDLEDFLAHN